MPKAVGIFLMLILLGCGRAGNSAPPRPNFVSEDALRTFGTIELESVAGRGDPKKALSAWESECAGKSYLTANVNVGMQIFSTENILYHQVTGGVLQFDWTSHYVVDVVGNYQLSVSGEHKMNNRFAKVKYRVSSGETWVDKKAIEVVASDEQVRSHFANGIPPRDCRARYGRVNDSSNWATFTLVSGKKVSGIVRKTSAPFEHYTCADLDSQGREKNVLVIAEKGTEELLTFYSKQLLNPLGGFCARGPTLLSSYSVMDASGLLVEWKKNEVTDIR